MNWHTKHIDERTLGARVADSVASFVGSWTFIFILSLGMCAWVGGNIYLLFNFDPFPFIFLNLFMSAMAAYSTPVIMMSQNRAAERDRHNAEADYKTNVEAKEEIESLMKRLDTIEVQKLDLLIENLKAVVEYLPHAVDTGARFEELRRATSDAALTSLAIDASRITAEAMRRSRRRKPSVVRSKARR